MLNSMTGFSSVSGEVRGFKFRIDARSLNHRFLEVRTRLPSILSGLDFEIEMFAKNFFERGRIEISVSLESEPENLTLSWNKPRAKAYLKAFQEMKDTLGLSGDISLELLINWKDVIISEPEQWGKESFNELEKLFRASFESLAKARQEEGLRLMQDIEMHLKKVEEISEELKTRQESLMSEARSRLKKKLEKLLMEQVEFDNNRLEQEIALSATRSDISEELERINSHLNQFQMELKNSSAKGKKLEFLVQELHREFNTISAKSQNTEIIHLTISGKTELERIRQQLQNVE